MAAFKLGATEYVVRHNGVAEGFLARYVLEPADPALAGFADGGHPIPEPVQPATLDAERARIVTLNAAALAAFAELGRGARSWPEFVQAIRAAITARHKL